MSLKINLKILLFINLMLHVILFEYEKEVVYEKNYIKDMRSGFLSTKEDNKFYYLGSLIDDGLKIIAFTDLNGDKLTDIITYKKEQDKLNFYVHYYTKKSEDEEEIPKFIKPTSILFSLENPENYTIRNLHVGSFFGQESEICYLISFDDGKEETSLLHYVKCVTNNQEGNAFDLNINSNILILNRNKNNELRLLYFDYTDNVRKICTLKRNENSIYCQSTEFEKWINKTCGENKDKINGLLKTPISVSGGLAFVDLDGNCSPDIVLTHEDQNKIRHIEIYTSERKYSDEEKYCLTQVIDLGPKEDYGPLAITKINDDKSEDKSPMLDILIPTINGKNEIKILKNNRVINYKWSNDYCNIDYISYQSDKGIKEKDKPFFNTDLTTETLEIGGYNNLKIDSSYPTIIRVGDFLGTSNPGILLRQMSDNTSIISLFQRKDGKFTHYTSFLMDKIEDRLSDDKFLMGLFFDIDETGTLSLILPTEKGKNYFFFNYKRTVFFLKAKLMNHQKNLFDTNLGATYRYIVTDKSGDRHMDVAHQLSQTSDMNIPLPYSIMGLDDTNNYVEYFQTISGNYVNEGKEDEFKNTEETDWKTNSPIIPNTQMMIFKFINTDKKYEWNVDLIVQPMEQIWLFLIIVVFVLLIVLGVIIYLHVKELKEEEKETNKFKSWFA